MAVWNSSKCIVSWLISALFKLAHVALVLVVSTCPAHLHCALCAYDRCVVSGTNQAATLARAVQMSPCVLVVHLKHHSEIIWMLIVEQAKLIIEVALMLPHVVAAPCTI